MLPVTTGTDTGGSTRHDDDGVGGRQRVLHDEGPAHQAERRPVSGRSQNHQRRRQKGGDGEPAARARRHRSSSTRYSSILRASGASGLRARYFRNASLDFSVCLLW